MNTDDINLAYKLRHALNENLDALPASTTERLAAARALALSRKKADAPAAHKRRRFLNLDFHFSGAGLGRLGVAIPLLALVVGLGGLYQYDQQQRIAELAELDAAVLADELPLTAYLDHGFNAYLESQQRQQ
ncbi:MULTISPECIES: DUF3619 family protein [unclassified Massilia]|uniref:DUF3619 family protein n=1 Tax=unclassified Massilia TaxID=2609279 RepID=UPI00178608B6|nr:MULTISPECIES: DUF3619 family protein [unclassified Massilia]MBD8532586.1 DUF3619 family protein [Massilia sp. CFBP 13647]MBD8672924.1 DUF3619 family protein [Massilia sp. CFBP 13721]